MANCLALLTRGWISLAAKRPLSEQEFAASLHDGSLLSRVILLVGAGPCETRGETGISSGESAVDESAKIRGEDSPRILGRGLWDHVELEDGVSPGRGESSPTRMLFK